MEGLSVEKWREGVGVGVGGLCLAGEDGPEVMEAVVVPSTKRVLIVVLLL